MNEKYVRMLECKPCGLTGIGIATRDLTIWVDRIGRACHVFVCPSCEEVRRHEWNPDKGRRDDEVDAVAMLFPEVLVIRVYSILDDVESNLMWTEFHRVERSAQPGGASA